MSKDRESFDHVSEIMGQHGSDGFTWEDDVHIERVLELAWRYLELADE